jgi:hypothetical protein
MINGGCALEPRLRITEDCILESPFCFAFGHMSDLLALVWKAGGMFFRQA